MQKKITSYEPKEHPCGRQCLLSAADLLRLGFFILLLLPVVGYSQEVTGDLRSNLERYLGSYEFNYGLSGKPTGFEKFRYFVIEEMPGDDPAKPVVDRQGRARVTGYVETIDDEKIPFKYGYLVKNKDGKFESFEFETVRVNKTRYFFKGAFLDRAVNEDGAYTSLRGTLSRYINGDLASFIAQHAPFRKYAWE